MKYERWFVAQFGKRPRNIKLTDDKLESIVQKMEGAKKELIRRREYDAKRTAALYAWQIKDGDK